MTDAPLLKSRIITMSPVYYGWVVLAAGTLGMMMTLPGQTGAVSVFIDPIMADLHLSRSAVSTIYGVASLAGAVMLPFVGRWIDQFGPRAGVTLIASLFALACFAMGWVTGPITLLLGFVAVRSLGQGALGLVSQHVVSQWFIRRRGFALGLMGVGLAIANTAFPIGIQALIEAFDWRTTYMILGGLLMIVMVPTGAGFFRQRPERYGLQPDGRVVPGTNADAIQETNMTRAEAMRTSTFWVFALGSTLVAGLATALIFHHFSLMGENGLSREMAATYFLPMGIVTAASNLAAGIALDRVDPRGVLQAAMLALMGALLLALVVWSWPLLMAYGACLGAAMGISSAVSSTVWPHYFGRLHLGSIRGLVQSFAIAGTAVVPLPFALVFDHLGSYRPAILVSLLLPVGLAIAVWRLHEPHTVNKSSTAPSPDHPQGE